MNTSKRIMTIIGIILMAAAVVMLIVPSQEQSSLEFEPIDGQFALLDKAHRAWFGDPTDPNDENAVATICDWIAYKSLVAADGESAETEQAIRETKQQLEADLTGLIANTSFSAIYWVGEQAFEKLAPLYEKKPHAREDILTLCQTHTPELARIIGNEIAAFDALSEVERLRSDDGSFTPETRQVAALLHRHLWFALAAEFYTASRFESPEERTAFLRWQIELSNMPIENKIAKLTQSENSDLNYDFAFAKAVLYARMNKFADACQSIQKALSGDDPKQKLTEFRKARYEKSLAELRRAHPGVCP